MPNPGSPEFGEDHVDGNALAGPLAAVFVAEVTGCDCRCGYCGRVGPLATAVVYSRCPGRVARCPGCARVLLRITETPAGTWLDLGAGAALRLPAADG